MPRDCTRAHIGFVGVTDQPGGYPGLQSWPQKGRVSKAGLGAALAEAALVAGVTSGLKCRR